MGERERKPVLSLPEPDLTPQQRAKALLAGRLAAGANLLLANGQISPEKHRTILRMLAPDVQPVIDAIARQVRDAKEKPDAHQ